MAGNFQKEDLRIKKTYKVLEKALLTSLCSKNFNQITVNDLCEEALVSRATFYVHFNDKYDLLKHCLSGFKKNIVKDILIYEKLEKTVNEIITDNQKLIANILIDANDETMSLIYDFILSIVNVSFKKNKNMTNSENNVLSCFCTGGIINLLLFQVKNRFPTDENMMTNYLYNLLVSINEWNQEQNVGEQI